jgi:hypothetical protein
MMISGPTRTVFADGDIADIAAISRALFPLAAAQIWCNFIERPSFSCIHGSSQSSFFCRFDDLLKVSLNVQLLVQLTFFFASETAFERPE